MRAMADLDKLVTIIQSVLPSNQYTIALHEPAFYGNEWKYVKECLDTGWVSSVGKYVDKFESDLVDYTGARFAIAVVNGTAALHICLKLAGVEPGDEVLLPSFTFIATANATSYSGAIPHFIDSDKETLGIDTNKLREYLREIVEHKDGSSINKQTGRRIKAVVPMHTFGHCVDIDPLLELCEEYNLELVEDAAESLGSYYKGVHTGNFGKVAAMSFNGNKVITTGGGGAILTNDESIAKMAKHVTTTAKVPHKWAFFHDQIGYNYRLPNINAALGCAQLEQIDGFINKKRALAESYRQALLGIEEVTFFTEPHFSKSNYWLNTLLLNTPDIEVRDTLLDKLNTKGIMSRPAWTLMHKLPMYADCPRMDLTQAELLEIQVINIPSSVILGESKDE